MTIRTTATTAFTLLLTGLLAAGCNSGSRSGSGSSSAAGVTSGTNNNSAQTFRLLSSTAGTGTGTVTVDPASANNEYPAGTSLRLGASARSHVCVVEPGSAWAGGFTASSRRAATDLLVCSATGPPLSVSCSSLA
jgi:hypothetical protein